MTTPLSNINIFIPHVFPNFDEKYIANAFKLIGVVDHMDFVLKQKQNGKLYNAVYIHFTHWLNNEVAIKLHNLLQNVSTAKLSYLYG